MSYKPITVTQLNTYIKQIFDAEELLFNISVVGEISGFSTSRGVTYFTLKDENSALSCVCFNADNLINFKNGDNVVAIGSVKYYTKTGKLNFNVTRLELCGEGALYRAYIELKEKLEKEGLFDASHKKPLPTQIKRIGVVSSETGAVIQDIINVRTRRNPGVDIVLYPVKVQGENAEYEIAHGITVLDNYNVDVIVVARGGGSIEDLSPFNTEVVARTAYNCNKPLVSAVGHETDYPIIDFVSDLRAPTPSAAAEILCVDVKEQKRALGSLVNAFSDAIEKYVSEKENHLKFNAKYLFNNFTYKYENIFSQIALYIGNYYRSIKNYTNLKENELKYKTELLNKLNPAGVLKLGYATVMSKDGYITSVKNVSVGDELNINLKDGKLKTKVLEVI